jgi:hypothetical protein
MADYEATGEGLQKLVKMGRKQSMPFAFCPSTGDDESLFATHRKKQPEIIAKAARKASGQTKVAFGTFTVEGKLMILVLLKELPSIAKKLKKHLRRERLSLNVKILDAMGNELESDIEDLGEDENDDDDGVLLDDDTDQDDTEETTEIQEEVVEEETSEVTADATSLVNKIKELKPGIDGMHGDVGDKLRTALAGVVTLVKARKLDRATDSLVAIERAYLRVTQSESKPEQTEAAPENNPADPEAQIQTKRLAELRDAAQKLSEPLQSKLLGALGVTTKQIEAGDVAKAATAMDKLAKAMGLPNTAAPTQETPNTAPEAATDEDAKVIPDPFAEKWAEVAAKLEPAVLAALRAGKGDVAAIRLKFYGMQDQAAAGNAKAALTQADGLTKMLREAQAVDARAIDADIPTDAVPFAKSRLVWSSTRVELRAQIGKLKSAMDATLANIEGMEEAVGETGKLFAYLDNLDGRLEDTLENLVGTPDGPARQTLKADARKIIAEYSTELDSDFFRDVDGDNGFAPVQVRGLAVSALQRIGAVLA